MSGGFEATAGGTRRIERLTRRCRCAGAPCRGDASSPGLAERADVKERKTTRSFGPAAVTRGATLLTDHPPASHSDKAGCARTGSLPRRATVSSFVTEAFVARVRDGGEGSGISAIASLWHIVKMGNGQNRGRAAKRVSGSPLKPARQGNESDRRPNQRAPTEPTRQRSQ